MELLVKKHRQHKIEITRQHSLNHCWNTLYTTSVPMITNYILKSKKNVNFDWKTYLNLIDTNIKQICKSFNIPLNKNPYEKLKSYLIYSQKLNTTREICNSLQLLINILTVNYNRCV